MRRNLKSRYCTARAAILTAHPPLQHSRALVRSQVPPFSLSLRHPLTRGKTLVMSSMTSACRNATRAVLFARWPLIAPARLVVPVAPGAAVRALSYTQDGGQGGVPWSGHGDDGGRHGVTGRSHRPQRRVVERRPGDWDCPTCGNHVFASRSVCPRCREPKPYEEGWGVSSSGGGGGVQAERAGAEEGGRLGLPVVPVPQFREPTSLLQVPGAKATRRRRLRRWGRWTAGGRGVVGVGVVGPAVVAVEVGGGGLAEVGEV
ncbi:unnamed protein product, partial [Ectocarpus sp. 6 AP-2014]